ATTVNAHAVDDFKHDAVSDFRPADMGRQLRIENVAFKRRHDKHVVMRFVTMPLSQEIALNAIFRITVVNDLKQCGQAFVEKVSVPDSIAVRPGLIDDVPEAFKGVALKVRLVTDGHVVELRPGFDEKQEQNA